ncbi:hypothetical protein MMC14_006720 [Varicellaria rhodocarpa]|nr:hypothetical protein [Varicellaria rhodocarpa]
MLRHSLKPPSSSLSAFLLPRRSPLPLLSSPRKRTLIAAPGPSSGPLMDRRSDRELPPLPRPFIQNWARTLPIFFLVIIASTLAIFNYQKASSSVVNATMYALRTSPKAREVLGDEIYFRDRMPWIWGELNQLHGRIDIQFGVKGKAAKGWMRFRSTRRGRKGFFETQEWSLETEDGKVIRLLEEERVDPFKNTTLRAEDKK